MDPDFACDEKNCESRKLDHSLQTLKVKHWTDATKLAKSCVKNKSLPLDSDTGFRMILQFFKKVQDSYKNSYALSTYAKNCKDYWNTNKVALLDELKQHLYLKKIELETERNKMLAYNLRKATKAKEMSTGAAIAYNSSSFIQKAIRKELLKESPNIESDRKSSSEEDQDSEDEAHSPDNENRLSEEDNIFTQEEPANSIGARIKQPAVDLHNIYMDNKELITTKQISIMVLGLSSILDLGNNAEDSQKSLFSEVEWLSIKTYYIKKYKIIPLPLPFEAYIAAWNTTVEIAKEKGLFCGLKYIASLKASPKTNEKIYKYLCIYEHV